MEDTTIMDFHDAPHMGFELTDKLFDIILLLEIDARHLQVYMECIAKVGREYGLSLNWSKVEQINLNC